MLRDNIPQNFLIRAKKQASRADDLIRICSNAIHGKKPMVFADTKTEVNDINEQLTNSLSSLTNLVAEAKSFIDE